MHTRLQTLIPLAMLLMATASCGRDAPQYARPDLEASRQERGEISCPGCETQHCGRFAIEALSADSASHEHEIFGDYLACLQDAGIQDPCLAHIPQSSMFSDRFYPADWLDYEMCQREHGVPTAPNAQQRCEHLLRSSHRSEQLAAREWFLAQYEACVHSLD